MIWQERCSKAITEVERLRRALRTKNERVEVLEAEIASNTMAGFGDMAAELGSIRDELTESQAEVTALRAENNELRLTVSEASTGASRPWLPFSRPARACVTCVH